jgi:hypothetical protein
MPVLRETHRTDSRAANVAEINSGASSVSLVCQKPWAARHLGLNVNTGNPPLLHAFLRHRGKCRLVTHRQFKPADFPRLSGGRPQFGSLQTSDKFGRHRIAGDFNRLASSELLPEFFGNKPGFSSA